MHTITRLSTALPTLFPGATTRARTALLALLLALAAWLAPTTDALALTASKGLSFYARDLED